MTSYQQSPKYSLSKIRYKVGEILELLDRKRINVSLFFNYWILCVYYYIIYSSKIIFAIKPLSVSNGFWHSITVCANFRNTDCFFRWSYFHTWFVSIRMSINRKNALSWWMNIEKFMYMRNKWNIIVLPSNLTHSIKKWNWYK